MNRKLILFAIVLSLFSLHSIVWSAGANEKEVPHLQRPFVNPKDSPDLPNVLIIGDSISIGYTVAVRKLLDGKADVFRSSNKQRPN